MSREYKLDFNLSVDTDAVPEGHVTCQLCHQVITENGYFLLTFSKPLIYTTYFDIGCFEQVIALGNRLYEEWQASGEIQN